MIERPSRLVIDTNVFVSATLTKGSTASLFVTSALSKDLILTSFATWEELSEVLLRQKFSRIRSLGERRELLASYRLLFQPVEVLDFVGDCRDPKDNKFLELALSGNADFIITGDADLLSLHPWRGIAILSPADYLALSE